MSHRNELFAVFEYSLQIYFKTQQKACQNQQVKDAIIQLGKNNNIESAIHFLHVMNTLATTENAVVKNHISSSTGSLHENVKINQVRTYIMENFTNRIEKSEISKIAGLSSNGFSRFFKQHTGLTFNEYVNKIRIEQATRLLCTTDDTISEIAYSCGFSSPQYFNRVFMKYMGMSPGKFRNRSVQL